MKILTKLIDQHDHGREQVVTLKPDQRHMALFRDACGLNAKSRVVMTPGGKKLDNYDETLLSTSEAISFRSTMRLAFVAADIPLFAIRLARHMAKPTVGTWNRLKRCVRYIHGHSRWIPQKTFKTKFADFKSTQTAIGNKTKTRNSVPCVANMLGTHCLRVEFATQTTPVLSSGEAESVAQFKGASGGIGL